MEKITPRVDVAFKKIFGVEENKDLLICLINSIVSEADQVADVQLLNPYNLKNFKEDKLSLNQASLKKALNVLEVMNFTEEEREAYEGHLKWLRIEASTLEKCEREGIEKGIEIGMIKERIGIAKNMLIEGLSIASVAKMTGLTEDEVEALKKDLENPSPSEDS